MALSLALQRLIDENKRDWRYRSAAANDNRAD